MHKEIKHGYFTFLDNFIFSCKHYVTTDIFIPRELPRESMADKGKQVNSISGKTVNSGRKLSITNCTQIPQYRKPDLLKHCRCNVDSIRTTVRRHEMIPAGGGCVWHVAG